MVFIELDSPVYIGSILTNPTVGFLMSFNSAVRRGRTQSILSKWTVLRERFSHVVVLFASCWACGDVSNAKFPVEFDELEDDSNTRSSQAVLDVRAESADAGASCPVTFRATLPNSGALSTLVNGSGERLIDEDGASVDCRVEPSLQRIDSFDVHLSLSLNGGTLRSFQAAGTLSEAGPNRATVEVLSAGMSPLRSECDVEVYAILAGAAWLRSFTCPMPFLDDEPISSCALNGAAIF